MGKSAASTVAATGVTRAGARAARRQFGKHLAQTAAALAASAVLATGLLAVGTAHADTSGKTIKILVGFPPGGGTDAIDRKSVV